MVEGYPIINGSYIAGYIVLEKGVEAWMQSEPDKWEIKVGEVHRGTHDIVSFMFAPCIPAPKKEVADNDITVEVNEDEVYQQYMSLDNKVSEVDKAVAKGQTLYGIGRRTEDNSFAMSHGPTTDLREMLDIDSIEGFAILQLTGDSSKDCILYTWDINILRWVKYKETPSFEVNLTYFKRTGKYYSEGSYVSPVKPLFEIWDDVRKMQEDGKLPGLVEGAREFIIEINVPDHAHAHPKLIIPPRNED